MEAKAPENKDAKAEYSIAKDITEGYKAPLKLYLEGAIDLDSTLVLVNSIYPIQAKNSDKVKAKITKFNIEKTFSSEIDKSDNTMIVYGIIGSSILFMLVYIYVEK